MTITNFRNTYKDRAVLIPTSSIELTESCHLRALTEEHEVNPLNSEPLCIVRRITKNTYALIIGYRDYITAKNSGAEFIQAIIVPDETRKAFLKSLDLTFEMCDLSYIHPPKGWKQPNPEKIKTCINRYESTGTFGKRIIATPDGTILDGYTAAEAAKYLRLERIPVYFMNSF